MHRNYTPAHATTLSRETFVSIVFNAIIVPAILHLLNVSPPQTLLGPSTLLAALVPGAAVATFMMTIILTWIVRARVSKASLPAFDWPRSERGLYRYIPDNLFARALVLAIVAAVILVPAGFAAVAVLDLLPFTKTEATMFNVGYGAAVALLMTRFVVLPALADRRG